MAYSSNLYHNRKVTCSTFKLRKRSPGVDDSSTTARNPGVSFDQDISLNTHNPKISMTALFNMCNTDQIRNMLNA